MEMLYRYSGLRQREIGALMGVDYSAVSISRKRFEHLMRGDRNVRLLAEKLTAMLCGD
jgi:predicted transcriptional regulator